MGQGLRCLFRVLKGHRVIFFNPIGPIRTGTHETRHPMPLASAQLRGAINSANPAWGCMARTGVNRLFTVDGELGSVS